MSLYKKLMQEDIFDRKDMPQVKTNDVKKALNLLKKDGIKITKGTKKPSEFKPSQKDIYKNKVEKILKRTKSLKGMKPVIVSRDNYIVDGHHRWAASKLKFPNGNLPYYKIDLPIQQAVEVYNKIADYLK